MTPTTEWRVAGTRAATGCAWNGPSASVDDGADARLTPKPTPATSNSVAAPPLSNLVAVWCRPIQYQRPDISTSLTASLHYQAASCRPQRAVRAPRNESAVT